MLSRTGSRLSTEQVESFQRDGFVFPIPVLTSHETGRLREELIDLQDLLGGRDKPAHVAQPHLHFRFAYDLATHPTVLDAVESVLGPNILVHSTSVFYKPPRDPAFISWHQDGYYWRVSEPKLATAWIAVSDSSVDNGCMRCVAGSHHVDLPHSENRHTENMLRTGLTVDAAIDESAIVNVVLGAGQMSLHHLRCVHGSLPNRSERPRIGFVARYLDPSVHQELEHHDVVLARGEDRYGHYQHLCDPPTAGVADGVKAYREFDRRNRNRRRRIRSR